MMGAMAASLVSEDGLQRYDPEGQNSLEWVTVSLFDEPVILH